MNKIDSVIYNKFRTAGIQLLDAMKDYININPLDKNFKDTPHRFAKAWMEVLSGGSDTDEQIKEILSKAFPNEGYDEMIVCRDIKTYSVCPHHLLPVGYIIDIGYIPGSDGRVLGISKLVRIGKLLASRPVLQEVLTKEIVDTLYKIKPLGVAVKVRGRHLCMSMRGVKTEGEIITSYMDGVFRQKPAARSEFLDTVKA